MPKSQVILKNKTTIFLPLRCTGQPRNMHMVYAFFVLYFVVVRYQQFYPYPSGLLHWHWGNHMNPLWMHYTTITKHSTTKLYAYFDGWVQDCSNSSALAIELRQSCTKPSISWGILITTSRNHTGLTGKMFAFLQQSCGNRMAWQWAETLVEIRGTLADIRGTTK